MSPRLPVACIGEKALLYAPGLGAAGLPLCAWMRRRRRCAASVEVIPE